MDRGAVVIVEEDCLVLMERVRTGKTYYLFPGGGVEVGETVEQAAVREAREELGLDVRLGRLLAVAEHDGNQQYHFWAEVVGGEFGSGDGVEISSPAASIDGSYRPVRLPLMNLDQYDVRPKALAQAICAKLTEDWVVLRICD